MAQASGISARQTSADHTFLPIVLDAVASRGTKTGWQIPTSTSPAEMWIRVAHEQARERDQGWKLHLSASVASAEAVLDAALPILLNEPVAFKLAASRQVLEHLNDMQGGASQIGKFITIYPNDDAQAAKLAAALDAATAHLTGPAIPSDRRLRPGSLVHYRYGGFRSQLIQQLNGQIVPAIKAPNGELVPDQRSTAYHAPAWVTDPFPVVEAPVEPKAVTLIGGRYLPMTTLHRSPRSIVSLAVDTEQPRRCVLKRTGRYVLTDARSRLLHEFSVLSSLVPDARFPAPFTLIEHNDESILVMEDVEGETLEQHVGALLRQGCFLAGTQVVAWGIQLAEALATVHRKGFVYRDLKTPNIIVAPDGQLRLIDFELASEPGGSPSPYGQGTRGYMSPQHITGDSPTFQDDVYGLGALLYFMATGVEPSHAPVATDLLARPIALLNPAIGASLAQVIGRCLAHDPADRFGSMPELTAALMAVGDNAAVAAPQLGGEVAQESEQDARSHASLLARELGTTICQSAEPTADGVRWSSTHKTGGMGQAQDVNAGISGTLLALAELVAEFDDPLHHQTLVEGARALSLAKPLPGATLAGLYVGAAGIAAALLRAGQVLRNSALIAAAAEKSRWIAALPHISPDLFNGSAGRLRFHLWLWDETGAPEALQAALAAGEAILKTATYEADQTYWIIPDGYGGLSGQAYLGYAHGAAGIADALLDLFEATGQERFLAAAQGAGHWLARQSIQVLDNQKGLNWPETRGQTTLRGGFWCHGAAGIGKFFTHAASLDILPQAQTIARGAAYTVTRGVRWANPTQCHGLAGNIEFLLDLFDITREHVYLAEARSLARLLETFISRRDGRLVCSSETPEIASPDYMVGYAGVAVCLLRLSAPEDRPSQLSRSGSRYLPQARLTTL